MVVLVRVPRYYLTITIQLKSVVHELPRCVRASCRVDYNTLKLREPLDAMLHASGPLHRSPDVHSVSFKLVDALRLRAIGYRQGPALLLSEPGKQRAVSDPNTVQLAENVQRALLAVKVHTAKGNRVNGVSEVQALPDLVEARNLRVGDLIDLDVVEHLKACSNLFAKVLMPIRGLVCFPKVFRVGKKPLPEPFSRNGSIVR